MIVMPSLDNSNFTFRQQKLMINKGAFSIENLQGFTMADLTLPLNQNLTEQQPNFHYLQKSWCRQKSVHLCDML